MKTIGKILCWFGFHRWGTGITTQHEWVIPDGEQLYLVNVECVRCMKKPKKRVDRLIIKKD